MERQAKIIAVAGKGGVGKTSMSAVIVKLLTAHYPDKRVLAIDADPAVGLATALGIDVKMTVDDIRKKFIDQVETGMTEEAVEWLGNARYMIFDALVEEPNYSFLAIGRPESAGCYCKVNNYLREVIKILADNYDYIIIDGEAGIEQINRRVMEKVSHLLLVTDASKKGIQVVDAINRVAKELVMYEAAGIVVNRMPNWDVRHLLETGDIPVLAYICADDLLTTYDIKGENVMCLPEDSHMVNGVRKALSNLNILKG